MKGNLYLIPVTLGNSDFRKVIPDGVIEITRKLRFFAVEDTRSARRYLRLIDKEFPIDSSQFTELSEHTPDSGIESMLDPALQGNDVGLMSEAGLPCIADPGARLVALAHRKKIRVIPLTGPSSIIMALIASGLNGQSFTFNGYLPVKQNERDAKIRDLMKMTGNGFAQVFMETPYRSRRLFEALLSVCNNEASLTVAADITLDFEYIRTMKIGEWKKEKPDIEGRLAVFVLQ